MQHIIQFVLFLSGLAERTLSAVLVAQRFRPQNPARPFPVMPANTRPIPGTKPGIKAARPGVWGSTAMLTDAQIRKAKPMQKPCKLTDGGGLHV